MNNFKFVFHSNLLYEIFQCTNILNLQLQNDKMDVVSAFRLSQTTIAHLYKIKENDFDAIYKTSIEICEKNDFNIQNNQSRRTCSNALKDLNEQYKQKFNNIIEVFINELTERFNI